ncbi:MAG TPA: 1-deoxy-D-xylulose-5-phosphate reductoisomerase [Firmicutes bacterium]|nr:1-deoxy-D-xylulose-5-phosphate reductoisomerase [Bacillota bacterium]
MEKKGVVILGSTGSIGRQALEVIENLSDRFRVVAIAAGTNVDLLAAQAARLRPARVVIAEKRLYGDLVRRLEGYPGMEVLSGEEAVADSAQYPGADIILNAIVGIKGLVPTLRALCAGKTVALANKETLVAGGELVMKEARKSAARIIPVDSEHSAIFQCLQGQDISSVKTIHITSSGGALRDCPLRDLASVTPEDALRHPTWNMGAKVTIDSATLMNKSLELIEARWLFDISPGDIKIWIHPQSIIHSMVEFKDGALLAQLGMPDMRLPIQYALTFPERLPGIARSLDPATMGPLTFTPPDELRYPALKIGYYACRAGGTMPAVMNAANEEAVKLFLAREIGFLEIVNLVEKVMEGHNTAVVESADSILSADSWARRKVREYLGHR